MQPCPAAFQILPMNRQALAHAAPVASFDPLGGFEEGIRVYGAEGRSLFPFQDVTSGADLRDCRELRARGPLRGKTTTAISRRPDSRLRRMTRPKRHSLPVARGPCDRSALRLWDRLGGHQRSWLSTAGFVSPSSNEFCHGEYSLGR